MSEQNAVEPEVMDKRRKTVSAALMIAQLPIVLILIASFAGGTVHTGHYVALGAGWTLFYGLQLTLWRCPSCRRRLGFDLKTKYCRSCGSSIGTSP